MQFQEPQHSNNVCPVCGKPVIVRSTRQKGNVYCSRVCASQRTHGTRYRGTMAGPADRPKLVDKTKWEG